MLKISIKKDVDKGASLLTYYGLLTIAPVFVFFFRLSQGFLSSFDFKGWLFEKFPTYRDQIQKLSETAASNPGKSTAIIVLAGSFLVFCWAGISILRTIEDTMNQIWESHSLIKSFKRIGAYLAVVLISPAIFLLSSGSFVYLTKVLPLTQPKFLNLNTSIIIFYFISYLLPYLIVCVLLSCMYMFMPHAEVKASPAFISGFIIGSLYYVLQAWYFSFQIKIFDYSVTYGALSSLPILIVWMYVCWYMFLIGGALTFSLQNLDTYSGPAVHLHEGVFFTTVICSFILSYCFDIFRNGKPAPSLNDLAKKLKIGLSETQKYTSFLINQGFLNEIISLKGKRYQPSSPLEKISIMTVFELLIKQRKNNNFPNQEKIEIIETSLTKILEEGKSSSFNLLVTDIESKS
ncbi:MAG: YihY/virulence factor BrkB family protein [Victivallaceae bacterium]